MIIASHQFQKRGLNVRDENGNEGCASCGRPRDAHPQPAPEPRPEVRTCYCGTTATVVPGVFPHSDCDGSVRSEPEPAPDLGAAHADLESEIRVAVSLHCTGPGVPCDLCLRETDRAMKAIDAYARDVAQHERAREQPAAETGTALYLSAISRLSAGLRDVRHACDRGDAAYAIAGTAAGALADVDRLRLPQSETELAAAMAVLQRDLADAEAEIARWPRCPSGCRCRVGTDDADALECGCDGPCTSGWDAPKPASAIGTDHGPVALRPALSATVVIAAPDPIGDDVRTTMTAAFAQDGLRAVFVENATAIGELPPDPALRADLKVMAARWDDQAATHGRDADKVTRSVLEAAVLLAKARVYDSNAAEVREAIGGEQGA